MRGPRQKGSDNGGTDARQAILDAAERIFGMEGYAGAVIRDIADAAGVNLGLIQYHCGTKDRLFAEAVNRRFAQWETRVVGAVEAAAAAPGASERDVIRAFLTPFLEVLASGDEGWINYLRLLGRGMSAYAMGKVHPALVQLSDIPDVLKSNLRAIGGLNDDVALDTASYVLEVTLTYLVQDRGLLTARTHGKVTPAGMAAELNFLTDLFAATFEVRRRA
ncbi:TetR family transcriptional regulator [Novosphingobium sp. KCTC 2891]|uniref:TetR/AcrR family transcriptional regulator n=1 Tax=Novosphingobium sp. KCTC 2891 TaxID=2989730 RepID=UPI002223DA87|nr:TetR/AcrR family transcriptional regulator [Novosphingobium sp. KCTC 2891]MCW1384863.1 TetR family transcriptional regulator [Novosphingobium sp. KCTC 2891]